MDKLITLKEAISLQDFQIGIELFKEYADQLEIDLAFQDFSKELNTIQIQYTRPDGLLIIAYNTQDFPLGCFGIRKWDKKVCELKRMYLRKETRGLGLGKRLLDYSIQLGQELGYDKMRLDTLSSMKAAINLYKKSGFYEIAPYRYNPIAGTKYMEIELKK